MKSSVIRLSSASASARSRAGLAMTCATTSLAVARRQTLRFELGARQRLDHYSLDDTMLDERPGDRLGQCACEDTVDDLLGFGRREHVLGHRLEPAARIHARDSAGLGQPLGSTSERCSDR